LNNLRLEAQSTALRLTLARHSNGDKNAVAGLVASAKQVWNRVEWSSTATIKRFHNTSIEL
jgi:hypothetical protein